MKNKKSTKEKKATGTHDTNPKEQNPSEDFFERLQEIYPTKTLDEIGDFLLNNYMYKRKFRIPKK